MSNRLFFFRRIAAGIAIGAVLATTWFHLSNICLTSNVLDEQPLFEVLVKHASLIVFQSMFALAIFVVVGLPIYFLARRIGRASLLSAIGSGFIVGLLVSTLYGGPDFDSLRGFAKMVWIFGIPGVIAAYAFWYFVREHSGGGIAGVGGGASKGIFKCTVIRHCSQEYKPKDPCENNKK